MNKMINPKLEIQERWEILKEKKKEEEEEESTDLFQSEWYWRRS
jgi:hypothetical protein